MRALILIPILMLSLTNCASKKVKKEVNEEMAKTPTITNESELYLIQKDILSTSENLSPEQKIKLTELIQKSKKQNQEIQNEIAKTKAILFKELVNEKENRYKINILESQLLKLNKKKTRYSISTYREAKAIVGKTDVPLEKTLMMIDNRTLHDF